jgi:predicted PhzF superfamily epimerase YddE/YHI9
MSLDLTLVDAFTDQPFAGNPAAVALVDDFPSDQWMQLVAREMNLSETAFVAGGPGTDRAIRWFTPAVEVDLCGHATLAAAHVLGGTARFESRSGLLACQPGPDGVIEMAFPTDPPSPATMPDFLSLGEVRSYATGRDDALAELVDAAAVRDLVVDLAMVSRLDWRGLIVTAPGDRPGIDCVSRFFAPNAGIAEDPVTGSAHCMLAEFWGRRTGKDVLVGEQASARGGTVFMRRAESHVVIGGRALTVGRVQLELDP